MEKSLTFNPSYQLEAFQRLEERGYITDLTIKRGIRGTYYWEFNLAKITFLYCSRKREKDFRQYRCKVKYERKVAPKVFILNPDLPKSTNHMYKDRSLCLYKPSNWQWQNYMQFDQDLFPNICTWLYHYEVWLKTGNWYGEEAAH